MIVLDTNVVSEALRGPDAGPHVLAWLRGLDRPPVTTVLTRAELLAGVAQLPDGQRKQALDAAVRSTLGRLGVCLPLTDGAADRYAEVVAARRTRGRPISGFDALIAAICLEAGAALATRNIADFEGLGLVLVNPWQGPV